MMYKTLILVVLLGLNLSVMARTKKDLRSKSVYQIKIPSDCYEIVAYDQSEKKGRGNYLLCRTKNNEYFYLDFQYRNKRYNFVRAGEENE